MSLSTPLLVSRLTRSLPPSHAFDTFLEGSETDLIARNPGHLALNGRPVTDREFFVSDFEFALRDGAFRIGNRTAVEMERFFQTVADELTGSDRRETHHVRRSWAANACPLPGDYGRVIASAFISLKKFLLVSGLSVPNAPVSSGDPADIARIAKITLSAVVPVKDAPVPSIPDPCLGRVAPLLQAWRGLIWLFTRLVHCLRLVGECRPLFIGAGPTSQPSLPSP